MFPTLDEVRAYAAEGRYRRVPVRMELLADRVGYFSYDYVKYAEPRLREGELADQKELAEHNMLVDLGRNNLGRICKLGSVHVDEYLSIHRFSHVMHIGLEVSGPLRRNAAHLRRVPEAPGHLRGVRRHGRLRQAADTRQGFPGEGRTR